MCINCNYLTELNETKYTILMYNIIAYMLNDHHVFIDIFVVNYGGTIPWRSNSFFTKHNQISYLLIFT